MATQIDCEPHRNLIQAVLIVRLMALLDLNLNRQFSVETEDG